MKGRQHLVVHHPRQIMTEQRRFIRPSPSFKPDVILVPLEFQSPESGMGLHGVGKSSNWSHVKRTCQGTRDFRALEHSKLGDMQALEQSA